jgi:predicted nucleic acid-binding protein
MIFLETSFIINYFVPKAQNHQKANEIFETIENKDKAISEMVVYETLTVLRKLKQNETLIKKAYNNIANSKNITVFEDILYYEKALDYTLNKNTIGFFDNLSYIVMKNNNIKTIASFDPDFDIFTDIERIH